MAWRSRSSPDSRVYIKTADHRRPLRRLGLGAGFVGVEPEPGEFEGIAGWAAPVSVYSVVVGGRGGGAGFNMVPSGARNMIVSGRESSPVIVNTPAW